MKSLGEAAFTVRQVDYLMPPSLLGENLNNRGKEYAVEFVICSHRAKQITANN